MIKSNYQREKTGKLTDVSTAFKLSERGNRRKLVHWYWFALTEGNGDKMEFQPQLLKPTFFFFCFTQPSMRNLTISYGWSKKGGGGTGSGRVRSVRSIISRARIFAFYCRLSTTGRPKHNNLPSLPLKLSGWLYKRLFAAASVFSVFLKSSEHFDPLLKIKKKRKPSICFAHWRLYAPEEEYCPHEIF